MRIISRKSLRDHWCLPGREDSEVPLRAWFDRVSAADWTGPQDVKRDFASASFVGDRIVFNVGGNKYRLVAFVNFPYRVVYVRFVGNHAEYDRVDVRSV